MTTTTSPCSAKRGAVVPRHRARAEHVRAAVDPHHHRAARVVARRRPHVEVEAVFARRACRRSRAGARPAGRPARDSAENCVASRTPSHASSRTGGRKRRGPTGGAANGMPRNTSTPSRSIPSIFPLRVATIVMAVAGYRLGSEVAEVGLALLEERRERLEVGGRARPCGVNASSSRARAARTASIRPASTSALRLHERAHRHPARCARRSPSSRAAARRARPRAARARTRPLRRR